MSQLGSIQLGAGRLTKDQVNRIANGDRRLVAMIAGNYLPLVKASSVGKGYNLLKVNELADTAERINRDPDPNRAYDDYMRKQGFPPQIARNIKNYVDEPKKFKKFVADYYKANPRGGVRDKPEETTAGRKALEQAKQIQEQEEAEAKQQIKEQESKVKQIEEEDPELKQPAERDIIPAAAPAPAPEIVDPNLKRTMNLVMAELKALQAQKQIDIAEQARIAELNRFATVLQTAQRLRTERARKRAAKEVRDKLRRLANLPTKPRSGETVPAEQPETQEIPEQTEEERKMEEGQPFDPEKVQRTEQDGTTVFGRGGAMALAISEQDEEREAKEEEEADKLATDTKPDISEYGHQREVSLIAVANGRDFTYYKTLITNNVAMAPDESYKKRKTQAMIMEMEFGPAIGWIGFTTDFVMGEVIELYALVTIFKEVIAEERAWKRSLIRMDRRERGRALPEGVGATGATGDLGMVMPLDAFGIRPQDLLNLAQAQAQTGRDQEDFDIEDETDDDESFGDSASEASSQAPQQATPIIPQPQGMFRVTKNIRGSDSMQNKPAKRKPSVRQPKDLNPQNLMFRTGTRFNPNLLMNLQRGGFDPSIPSVDRDQPAFNRVKMPEKTDPTILKFRF